MFNQISCIDNQFCRLGLMKLAVINIPGRYEVISRDDRAFIVIPVPPDAILVSNDSHKKIQ